MLLAAQLSSEPEHQKDKDKLYKASRIQDFLDSIQESLVKYGTIRRSQTFLGSTVCAIKHPDKWITEQKQAYKSLSNTLKSKQETIRDDIRKAQRDSCEYLEQQIKAIFQDLLNAIPQFAESQWETNEHELNRAWKQQLDILRLEKRLQLSNKEAIEKFGQAIEESLEEVGKELQLTSLMNINNFQLIALDNFSWKNLIKIGGSILGAAAFFLGFAPFVAAFAIPVGFALVSNLFMSRKEKRRKAVANISNALREQINKQKRSVIESAIKELEKYCSNVSKSINSYFDELTNGLDDVSNCLENAQRSLDATVNYLNCGYAKRIIDWSTEQYEPLTVANVKKVVAKVDRKFGQSITIQSKTEIETKKSLEEMKQVLQEDIVITSN